MKQFTIKQNNYLKRNIKGYYNCDYVGYRKQGNPDFINRLKNTSKSHSELDLVEDFIEVAERTKKDLQEIMNKEEIVNPVICVIPRSKSKEKYSQNQLMFKKAISSVVDNIKLQNGANYIVRTKDTKTTHNWYAENNSGSAPYPGITKDTCQIEKKGIINKDIILVDDVYTENVNIAEDCIQTLLDFGAKNVILYVIAKTRSN